MPPTTSAARGYPTDAAAILLCELDGIEEEVEDQIADVRAVLEHCGATQVRVARDEAERVRFWAGRKAAFPAAGRLSPDYLCMDGTIPRRELPAVLQPHAGAVGGVGSANHERVPRRRRQPPPVDPL